ncbi:hypothetical protein ACWDBO_06455 [Streptomyces mirabilis]|jgi:hypothetical protein|uniref:hypothetical protein n=1 Tax=Streptomyces TaxID=1883 RepID=UPI0029A93B95|nr:hypothetical protein [Streptomyces sp. AK02-04a]MDX3757634.1 hypothetical protein [Streptomyces sp. AK02-04a]
MFHFKRFGSAVASAAALASLSLVIAPAAMAATNPQPVTPVVQESKGPKPPTPPTPPRACATLSGELATQLQAAATALAATPTPDVAAAQAAVAAAQTTVAQLRAAGCLPAAPPTRPTCATLAVQLQADLQVLTAALAAVPQVPANITAALNAVLATDAQLSEACT